MKTVFAFLLVWIAAIVGCSSTREVSGDDLPPGMSISPAQAFALANPHLDAAFEQIVKERPDGMLSEHKPWDVTYLKGKWYHIKRDNNPVMNINLSGAVRVHGTTGEVVTP